jgi:hypothetical protein
VILAHGSAKFQVDQTMLLAGKKIKPGEYDVTYELNNQSATVIFKIYGKVAVEVHGKIVESAKPYDYDALVVGKDLSGHETIKGLQFRGEKTEIDFE